MSDYKVEGIRGKRSGRPFAYTSGYFHTFVELGLRSPNSVVEMELALAETVPIISHTAIHLAIRNNVKTDSQTEVNLHAALLFTNLLVPEKIRHAHDADVYRKAGASEYELLKLNGMVSTAILSGLNLTERLIKKPNIKEAKWFLTNVGFMRDMVAMMRDDGRLQKPTQFLVKDDILVRNK